MRRRTKTPDPGPIPPLALALASLAWISYLSPSLFLDPVKALKPYYFFLSNHKNESISSLPSDGASGRNPSD